jgi:hypothetical protein
MVQLVVNNIFLDLYENDSPKLTYSIEDITDTKITSTYSQNFRVPATKQNTKFFKSAFEINGFDFDVTVKINATILLDGQEFKKGQIRLQKIYLTNEGNAADYEIIFLGEARSFASEVGSKLIRDLDLSEYNVSLTETNIVDSWKAYPQSSSLTAGLKSGSVLFPLADFGNTYSGSTVEQTRMAVGTGRHFTNPAQTWPLTLDRFKPMIRAKAIWDKIFEEANYTYTSEFLNSNLFHQLYISAWGNEPSVYVQTSGSNLFQANSYGSPYTPANYMEGYVSGSGVNEEAFTITNNQYGSVGNFSLKEVYDYGSNYSPLGFYTTPLAGVYDVEYSLDIALLVKEGVNEDFRFYTFVFYETPSGPDIADYNENTNPEFTRGTSFTHPIYGPVVQYRGTINMIRSRNCAAGEKISLGIEYGNAIGDEDVSKVKIMAVFSNTSYFSVIAAPGEVSISQNLKDDYKQIDFIKDISTKFRLVLAPDPSNPDNFIIEPWKDYIMSGDVYDWTQKLDYSKDIVIEPVFNTQKAVINFTDKEDKDWLNTLNIDQFNEVFGALEVDPQNELLTDEREIKTTLAPTPIRQIQGWFSGSTVAENFVVPHIYTIESTEGGTRYTPIEPTTRLLFYNGLVSGSDTWYHYTDLDIDSAFVRSRTTYPRVSPYQVYTSNSFNNLDLNWQRETGYQYYPSLTGSNVTEIGYSVYDEYWDDYISSLYDKWSRKVTAYFTLEGNDLRDFGFDDIIYVKGTYYYVEKIYDVPLDKREPVKVDLIKYDYSVPGTGFIPPTEFNVWGSWPVVWNTTTDTWDD